MTLYELLNKKKKARKPFENSEEYEFFAKHRDLLTKIPRYAFLYDKEDDFSIIRANIVIYGLLNKQVIEEKVYNLSKKIDPNNKNFLPELYKSITKLPYYSLNKTRVYVPIFSLPLNNIYYKEPYKLLTYPYNLLNEEFQESTIDCFDTYGALLYDSNFTRLIKVSTNGKEVAYFHYDTNTVYVVNNQGRLDNKIVLFDKYITKIYDNHMLERLKIVMEPYFNNSRSEFIQALFVQQFISRKMFLILKKGDYRNNE